MKNSLKQRVQAGLRRAGLYHRLKASRLYDWYWSVADRSIIQRREEELAFYRANLTGLRAGDLVIDVGANQGFKTEMFLRLGARVVAVDPDATNQEILAQSFTRLRLCRRPVTIISKALGKKVGTETMFVNEPGSAKNTLNKKWVETLNGDTARFGERLGFAEERRVEVTTLEELMREHGVPFYVKIDVEGYEAVVMKGLKSPVPMLSFEVNLPEFRAEAKECIAMLERIDLQGRWNFIADCAGGMHLKDWATSAEMVQALEKCALPTVEVFWKSPAGLARLRGNK